MKNGGWLNRIHRWFWWGEQEQRIGIADQGSPRVIRTVETVQREEKTILIGTLNAGAFKTCPLCGQNLGPPEDDSAHPHLLE
jgi:hypothetical protein